MYEITKQRPMPPMSDRLKQTMLLLKKYDTAPKEAEQGLRDDLGFSSVEDARRFVRVELAKQL